MQRSVTELVVPSGWDMKSSLISSVFPSRPHLYSSLVSVEKLLEHSRRRYGLTSHGARKTWRKKQSIGIHPKPGSTHLFMLTDFLPSSKTHRFWWGGVGMLTFIGTCTHTWCYATARSSATSTHTWCYATARSSATSTHIRDATPLRVLLQLPHIRDATLGWGGVGMLTFIGTCTHTWCYATAPTPTHTWCYATARSSATSTHTWCYATVLIRLRASWRRKNAERVVDGKVKPSSSETPFFQSKLTFRYGETII